MTYDTLNFKELFSCTVTTYLSIFTDTKSCIQKCEICFEMGYLLMFKINNLANQTSHIVTEQKGIFSIVEYNVDFSVAPCNAMEEYYMSQMNVKRKQAIANLNGKVGLVLQAGAMQYIVGNVQATTGLKGVGDFLGKMVKSSVTKESAIKPEYVGTGVLVTEPTYKYLLTENVGDWTGGLVMEDGMFLACESTVKHEIQARSSLSSAALGNEGLFNLRLAGNGVCVLESNVPRSEIVEIDLQDDVLKIDGGFAICWSGSLSFTVERSGKTLLGSAASGEGLVNVYKGTGKVWLAPLTPSQSLVSATHAKNAK